MLKFAEINCFTITTEHTCSSTMYVHTYKPQARTHTKRKVEKHDAQGERSQENKEKTHIHNVVYKTPTMTSRT